MRSGPCGIRHACVGDGTAGVFGLGRSLQGTLPALVPPLDGVGPLPEGRRRLDARPGAAAPTVGWRRSSFLAVARAITASEGGTDGLGSGERRTRLWSGQPAVRLH
jgi:hypothetical protein